jgi:hypothetical protein
MEVSPTKSIDLSATWMRRGPTNAQDSLDQGLVPCDTFEISSEARKAMGEMLDPLLPSGIYMSSLKGLPSEIRTKIASAKDPNVALRALEGWAIDGEQERKTFERLEMLLQKNI